MQFSCDQCRARYQIADEKAAGKRLRIRCKRCGHSILLDGRKIALNPAASIPPSSRSPDESIPPAPSPSEPASPAVQEEPRQWFAIIDAEEFGPATRTELFDRVRGGGAFSAKSYVWREGMDQWQRLEDVAELSDLLQWVIDNSPVTQEANARHQGEERQHLAAVEEARPQEEERQRLAAEEEARRQKEERQRLAAEGEERRLEEERQRLAAEEEVRRQEAERLRLVAKEEARVAREHSPRLADALAFADPVDALADAFGGEDVDLSFDFPDVNGEPAASDSEPASTEESDAASLSIAESPSSEGAGEPVESSSTDGAISTVDAASTDESPSAEESGASPESASNEAVASSDESASQPSRKSGRPGAIAAVAVVLLIAGAGGAYTYFGDSLFDVIRGRQGSSGATAGAEAETGKHPLAMEADRREDLERRAAERKERDAAVAAADAARTGDVVPLAVLREKVAALQPVVDQCISEAVRQNPEQKLGTVIAVATVAPSGVVSDATFTNDGFAGSELGKCVAGAVKSLEFPPFEGEATAIEIPLDLGEN